MFGPTKIDSQHSQSTHTTSANAKLSSNDKLNLNCEESREVEEKMNDD